MIEDNNINDQTTVNYDEGNIQTLTGLEHIRLRPWEMVRLLRMVSMCF